jgi:uncharacterized protein involved in exopolysaccharide biosynthesis
MEGRMDVQETTRGTSRDFLHIVFKRKGIILLFFFATICTVALFTFMETPTYEASSQILVKIGREDIFTPEIPTGSNAMPTYFNRQEQINSEIEILSGRALAERVITSIGAETIYQDLDGSEMWGIKRLFQGKKPPGSILERAYTQFEKNLEVGQVEKSNIIEIQFSHENPQMAADVVNKMIGIYADLHLEVHRKTHSYNFFRDQVQESKDKLEQAEQDIKAFKRANNIHDLDEEKNILLRQKTDLEASLKDTINLTAETENRVNEIEKQLESTPRTVSSGENIEPVPQVISELQSRLVALELELTRYNPNSPLAFRLREDIRLVEAKLKEQETKRYGKRSIGINRIYQNLQEELYRNEAELKALNAKRMMQNSQIEEYERSLEKHNQIEVELKQLEEEVELARQNYRLYLAKFEEARISDAMDEEKISNIRQIQRAYPPISPSSPKVILNLVVGVIISIIVGIAVAFFVEYMDDRLERPEQAEDFLGIPVLASIPELKS